MHRKQQIGLYGEELAEKFLITNGYQIIAKRFRTRFAEIDLIASMGETLAFVEVKTRTTTIFGQPEAAVNYHKIKKMMLAAKRYVQQYDISDKDFRLDCLAIDLNLQTMNAKIRHYKNINY